MHMRLQHFLRKPLSSTVNDLAARIPAQPSCLLANRRCGYVVCAVRSLLLLSQTSFICGIIPPPPPSSQCRSRHVQRSGATCCAAVKNIAQLDRSLPNSPSAPLRREDVKASTASLKSAMVSVSESRRTARIAASFTTASSSAPEKFTVSAATC